MGRAGLGRGRSTRTSIGMEPILDQQGILQGFTVRAYFRCALHCYSDAWRTIVRRFITVLLSFERLIPRQYLRVACLVAFPRLAPYAPRACARQPRQGRARRPLVAVQAQYNSP